MKISWGEAHLFLEVDFTRKQVAFGECVDTINAWQSIFFDGVTILIDYRMGIFIFFICVFGIGLSTTKLIWDKQYPSELSLLSTVSIGCIALSLLSYIFTILALLWPPSLKPLNFMVLIVAISLLVKQFWTGEIKTTISHQLLVGSSMLFFLLLIRLAYLTRIILPPYSDSPIHYQIAFGILHPDKANIIKLSLSNILTNYYHYGFHALAAWLTVTSGLELSVVIPLLGQLSLVIAPISAAALTYGLTKSNRGAFFSGLLSAIGWLMPSFAVNWGKFPALAAIATTPVVLLLLWFALHSRFKLDKFSILAAILAIGITLIHTRIIVSLLIAFGSFFLARKLQFKENPSVFQTLRFSLLFALILWPLSRPLMNFYNAVPTWIVLLVLIPFAFHLYPTESIGVSLFLFGTCLVALIPSLLDGNNLILLDRQFLEMSLCVPLSTMGGLGFSGLTKKLEWNTILKWVTVLVLCGFVLAPFIQSRSSIYPNECCNYFKQTDQAAFQWLKDNSSDNTLIMISAFSDEGKTYGTDAGVWLYPLMGTPTNKLAFSFQWNSTGAQEKICMAGAPEIYIYAGGKRNSFDELQLAQVDWVERVFQNGEVVIYKVSNCTNQ